MNVDDDATRLEEAQRESAMKVRRPTLPSTGFCHNCGEPCQCKFCDDYCKQDFSARMRFKGKAFSF